MKVKLPHKVWIGPKSFSIVYKSTIKVDNEVVGGSCYGPKREIEISLSESHTREELLETLWHEIIHAVLYVSGQSSTLNNDDQEEGIVVALEGFLADAVDWNASMFEDWKPVKIKGEKK